jgi:CBS-domain-containing membrane protein
MSRPVADLMKQDVVTIAPDASLLELVRVLRDEEIGGMPVVDDDGRVVGTVSSTDLLWLAAMADDQGTTGFLNPAELADRTVRDIMTPDVFGVLPDASMSDLRRFFARTAVHRALVLDEDGKLVGIVVLSDVLGTLV